MPADPVVSPADTLTAFLEELCNEYEGLIGGMSPEKQAEWRAVSKPHAALASARALLAAGERDRRQIAQLTEVGKAALIVADLNGEMRSTYGRVVTHAEWSTALCNLEMVAIAARAVLADEEDAANG